MAHMPKKLEADIAVDELRRRAEARLRISQAAPKLPHDPQEAAPKPSEAGPARHRADADTKRLLHELQVHQVELELQNAELSRARTEAEANAEKFSNLYDFAPVGYFTFAEQGGILGVNL